MERLRNIEKLFRHFQKCSGRVREVPGGLWKYPEGYRTLWYAKTESRPSRKVHKTVGRWKGDFPWGQGKTPGFLAFPPQDARVYGVLPLDVIFCGVLYWNPCWTPSGGQNRLWGDPSPKLRPQASTNICGAGVAPKLHWKSPKAALAKSHAPLILFWLDRSSPDAARLFSL